ncbi:hypothetical protein F5Y16DRAFT_422257 [Xylariaceae sp. FL0255]|nr:hypothetical protein F5Y16DRAFT_422257 [Xylariaceae sp. FL0255]
MDTEFKESAESLLGTASGPGDYYSNRRKPRSSSRIVLAVSWLITLALLASSVKEELQPGLHDIQYNATLKYNSSHLLYRPPTEPSYVGTPTPEMDAEWDKLEAGADIFITPKEQELLGGDLYLDEEFGLYLAEVAVFHDLHCLVCALDPYRRLDQGLTDDHQNFIRKSLYPEYYSEMTSWSTWRPHLEHCIDAVRLSLMCASDMTLIPVKWSENRNWTMPIFETVHTCRDFDTLHAWAVERESIKDATFRQNAAKLRAKAGLDDPQA